MSHVQKMVEESFISEELSISGGTLTQPFLFESAYASKSTEQSRNFLLFLLEAFLGGIKIYDFKYKT